MLVSLDWLKEYTKVDREVSEYIERMNLTGSKVENVDYKDKNLKDIIVAKIIKKEKHPNADKLSVCTLDIGGGKTEIIITAAANIKEGDTIPLALPGSVITDKKIDVTEFRGITSNGMMCSGEELGLDASVLPKNSEGGIYVFSEELTLGQDALTHLGLHDVVIDFEITNNRPDCQSMIGMAREFAAAFYNPVKVPEAKVKEAKNDIDKYLSIEIADPDLCHRYVARMMKVKKIQPSPLWMQRRLMACGFRPINNIVDVTNYILLEAGQPLHAFDYKMIEGNKITVRRAKHGEKITTLDGKERTCCDDLLLIADTKKGVGIAGIMGGANSEITNSTEMIVLESAAFNADNIRKSSVKMNMNTDAAALFSKGVNAGVSDYAATRAAQLLIQIGACELIEGIIDIYPAAAKPVKITVDSSWVNRFLGMKIPLDDMLLSLKSLGIEYSEKDGIINVISPMYRTDINIKEDVAEEIARIYGYEKIPSTLNNASSYVSPVNQYFKFKTEIKNIMASMGAFESLTYTFTSYDNIKKLNMGYKKEDIVKIINPLGENTAYMRTSLMGSLLEVAELNLSRKNNKAVFFEIGNVFFNKKDDEGLPVQKEKLAMVCYGGYDFYDIKGIADALFKRLGISDAAYSRSKCLSVHPGKSADVTAGEEYLGCIGQVHPAVSKEFDIEESTYVFEFDVKQMYKAADSAFTYMPIPKYPSITRDMAVIVSDDVLSGDVLSEIIKNGTYLLADASLFDVYTGDQIETGYKSLAFSLEFRSKERTLTDSETDKLFDIILLKLENKFKAKLRQ